MPVKTKNEMRKYNREYYAKKVADRPNCFVCGKKFSPVKYTDENGFLNKNLTIITFSICYLNLS